MGLNTSVFKTRSITAVLFLAVMLTALLWCGLSFIMITGLIALGSVIEFIRLSRIAPKATPLLYLGGMLYIIAGLLAYACLGFNLQLPFTNFNSNYEPLIPCLVIFSLWINDTMAYVVGSFLGKTPLSKISPKKTWEGTIGGIILAVFVVGMGFNLLPGDVHAQGNFLSVKQHPRYLFFVVPFICAVSGTLGDLLESKFKRFAGVKDSGRIMPGHGGFLDRFDSLLLAAPVTYLFLKLAMIV